jgi:DUF1680 family protein
MVYYRDEQGLAVNLYTTSQAECSLHDGLKVAVRQETDYPNSGRVVIGVNPSRATEFALRLRIPAWCATARATVNGQAFGKASGGDLDGAVEDELLHGGKASSH